MDFQRFKELSKWRVAHDYGEILTHPGNDVTSCLHLGTFLSALHEVHKSVFKRPSLSPGSLHSDLLAARTSVSEGELQQEEKSGPASRRCPDRSAVPQRFHQISNTLYSQRERVTRCWKNMLRNARLLSYPSSAPTLLLSSCPQRRKVRRNRCWRWWEPWWWAVMPNIGSSCAEECSSWCRLLGNSLDTRSSTCWCSWSASVCIR